MTAMATRSSAYRRSHGSRQSRVVDTGLESPTRIVEPGQKLAEVEDTSIANQRRVVVLFQLGFLERISDERRFHLFRLDRRIR